MTPQRENTSSDFECQAPEVYSLQANELAVEKDHTYSNKRYQRSSSPITEPHSPANNTLQLNDSLSFIDNSVVDLDYSVEIANSIADQDYSIEDASLDLGQNKHGNSAMSITKERKFVVYESKLDELFKLVRCSTCGGSMEHQQKRALGTSLHNQLTCMNGHIIVNWHGQPLLGKLPAYNLLMTASIFCSG